MLKMILCSLFRVSFYKESFRKLCKMNYCIGLPIQAAEKEGSNLAMIVTGMSNN